jgi:hypothetical protein
MARKESRHTSIHQKPNASKSVSHHLPKHVVPAKDGWAVKVDGAERATKHFRNKEDAIAWARETAKQTVSEVVVHKRDGTIGSKNSYGSDPKPPKDRKR